MSWVESWAIGEGIFGRSYAFDMLIQGICTATRRPKRALLVKAFNIIL